MDHPDLLHFFSSIGVMNALEDRILGHLLGSKDALADSGDNECPEEQSEYMTSRRIEMLVSDLKMIRVIEDVIDILMAKNLIIFSDLPSAVQEKILKQKGRREKLFGTGGDIIGVEDGLL